MRSGILLLFLSAVAAAAPRRAKSDDPVSIRAAAESAMRELDYERALPLLKQWLAIPGEGPKGRAQVLVELGITYVNLGNDPLARSSFDEAVEMDPSVSLPAESSPRVAAVFREAQQAHRPAEAPPPESPQAPPPPPPQKPVEDVPRAERPRPPAPESAMPPAPVVTPIVAAEVQPPKYRGLAIGLFGASVLAVAVGAGLGIASNDARTRLQALQPDSTGLVTSMSQPDAVQLDRNGRNEAVAANILFAGAATLALSAVSAWWLGSRL